MKINKTFLILGIIATVGALIFTIYTSKKMSQQEEPIIKQTKSTVIKVEPVDQTCLDKEECTRITIDCLCSCGNLSPINIKHKDKYDDLFFDKCGDSSSWVVCEHCCPFTLQCVNKKCTFVETPGICD